METYKKGTYDRLYYHGDRSCGIPAVPAGADGCFQLTEQPEMYDIGIPALRYISLCFLPAAFGIMSSSIFRATAHGFF